MPDRIRQLTPIPESASAEVVCEQVAPVTTADLTRPIEQRRRDGVTTLNGHWILHHMVEHMAGHDGRIRLPLHLQRAGVANATRPR
jgi:hypothetical protein